MTEPRDLPKLLKELSELCCCGGEENSYHPCIYCDAKEQIQAQQRTIQQAQTQIGHLGRIKNERLTWGLVCDHQCTACDDLDRVIRGIQPESSAAAVGAIQE